jgi:ABC-type antimicrobial peptide transport system permease subunit
MGRACSETSTDLGVALAVSGVTGLFGGFLPVLQAARLQPVQAVRD